MENDVILPSERAALDERLVAGGPATGGATMPAPGRHLASADQERVGVFASLVREDSDITGLVAYSIYKQNKLDWLQAFETIKGRAPNESELAAYIIGESTPRRLATYRHLAESTLAGKGPDVEAGSPRGGYAGHRVSRTPAWMTPGLVATYVVLALLFITAFWLAAHYTVTSH